MFSIESSVMFLLGLVLLISFGWVLLVALFGLTPGMVSGLISMIRLDHKPKSYRLFRVVFSSPTVLISNTLRAKYT